MPSRQVDNVSGVNYFSPRFDPGVCAPWWSALDGKMGNPRAAIDSQMQALVRRRTVWRISLPVLILTLSEQVNSNEDEDRSQARKPNEAKGGGRVVPRVRLGQNVRGANI